MASEYRYEIINKGNSPAFFEKVEYFLDLKPIDMPLKEIVSNILKQNKIRTQLASITQMGQENVMKSGEITVLMKILFHPEDFERFKNVDGTGFGIRITYRSAH